MAARAGERMNVLCCAVVAYHLAHVELWVLFRFATHRAQFVGAGGWHLAHGIILPQGLSDFVLRKVHFGKVNGRLVVIWGWRD